MKTLRAHGFNQRPRFEQVVGYLERNEPLPKPLLPGRFCTVQQGPQPSAPAAHAPAGNSRGQLPHSRRGHGRGCAPCAEAKGTGECRRRSGGSGPHRRRGRSQPRRPSALSCPMPQDAAEYVRLNARRSRLRRSASWTRRGSARRRWSAARRRPLRRRRLWLRRRARLPGTGLAEGAAALAPTAGEVAGTLAGAAGVARRQRRGWPWASQRTRPRRTSGPPTT